MAILTETGGRVTAGSCPLLGDKLTETGGRDIVGCLLPNVSKLMETGGRVIAGSFLSLEAILMESILEGSLLVIAIGVAEHFLLETGSVGCSFLVLVEITETGGVVAAGFSFPSIKKICNYNALSSLLLTFIFIKE